MPNIDLINVYRRVKHINTVESLVLIFTNEKEVYDILVSINPNAFDPDYIFVLRKYSSSVINNNNFPNK